MNCWPASGSIRRDDILTGLIHAEEEGEQLTEDELVAMAFLLIIAGYETTVNLITNGALTLLQHPDSVERLRAEPELWDSAVEEIVRYNGVPSTVQSPSTPPKTWRGTERTIPKGTAVFPLYGRPTTIPTPSRAPRCSTLRARPTSTWVWLGPALLSRGIAGAHGDPHHAADPARA